jgi:hypothetical protein
METFEWLQGKLEGSFIIAIIKQSYNLSKKTILSEAPKAAFRVQKF